MELNHLPSGYEPPALTDELQPRTSYYTMYFNLLRYILTNHPCVTQKSLQANFSLAYLGYNKS